MAVTAAGFLSFIENDTTDLTGFSLQYLEERQVRSDEGLYLEIMASSLPRSFNIRIGSTKVVPNTDGYVVIPEGDLSNLRIDPSSHYSGRFTMITRASLRENGTGGSADASDTLQAASSPAYTDIEVFPEADGVRRNKITALEV